VNDSAVYWALSAVMFLEYAVWGAWAPVLAARLLGPLKMTGKQTGWIYATLPIACIFAPLLAGMAADKYVNAEYILLACHAIGAVLLLVAFMQESFWALFWVMLAYSICFAATMPLVNSVVFAHAKNAGNVFIWAPIAWALVGYTLSGWRMLRGEGKGGDCFVYAALLSVLMAVCCYFLPATAPKANAAGAAVAAKTDAADAAKTDAAKADAAKADAAKKPAAAEDPLTRVFAMLKNTNFLVFVLVSMAVAGMMQFYFLGSAQFMIDNGISGKAVPASMAIAQAAQAIATFVCLGGIANLDPKWTWTITDSIGYQWTLVAGAGCWLLLYIVYVATTAKPALVVIQMFHGMAYVFFMIAGQFYCNAVAAPEIQSTLQALIFAATVGVGLFLGTQLAGIVMDTFSVAGKFQWKKIWMVPLVIVAIGTIVLAVAFHDDSPKKDAAKPAADNQAASVVTPDRQAG
jgi:MFS family permease